MHSTAKVMSFGHRWAHVVAGWPRGGWSGEGEMGTIGCVWASGLDQEARESTDRWVWERAASAVKMI